MSDNYIGHKISLISKADVRYEGILHDVDKDESTIALENGILCLISASSLFWYGRKKDGSQG